MKKLQTEFDPQVGYIMKKNVQQQKDIILTRDVDEIQRKLSEYVVVQELLQDPYIVKGRKCNMRVYVLIIVSASNKVDMYYYNDGFMYYTVEPFKKYSVDPKEVITTGLAGRDMYRDRPLTHEDFGEFLGRAAYLKLCDNIKGLVRYIKAAYVPILMEENKGIPGVKFLIYGMDVAPDEKLDCKIMEVNKGPDLTPKDARDAELKKNMMIDALRIAGVVSSNVVRRRNGFVCV